MCRGHHSFVWLAFWAIALTIAIVALALSSGSGWTVGVGVVLALVLLLVLALTIGDRKSAIIVFLAGAGFCLQVFALSSLFSDLRVGAKAQQGQLNALTLQVLGLAANSDVDSLDLTTEAGQDEFKTRFGFLELMTILNTGETADIRGALTPNYVDISLFAFGTLIGFGAAAVGSLPDRALPQSFRSFITPDA